MSKGAIIGIIVPGVLGVLALAATVPLDQAKSNLATYSKLSFRLGIILLIVAVVFAVWSLIVKWQKRKHSTAPRESRTEPVDHWAERQRLEISVLANVSAGRASTDFPIDKDPENSRLRELKDGIAAGSLDAEINGRVPNVRSTVTLADFEMYVAAANKPYWIEVLHRWQAVQNATPKESDYRVEYKKILELAANKQLPNSISEGGAISIDIFRELYDMGYIDAIDISSCDGTAYLEPRITGTGRHYLELLKHELAEE